MSQSTTPPAPAPDVMSQFFPPQRPAPQPPNCFSQLYALNQCYDDILMMQRILQKVICDMACNNEDFQKCLVDGITKSGSNVPLIGVTNGSAASPGQVGEFISFSANGTIPQAPNTQTISGPVVPPGDWDLDSSVVISGAFTTFSYNLGTGVGVSPATGYAASSMGYSVTGGPPDIPSGWQSLTAPRVQFNVSVPTLLTWFIDTNAAGSATGQGNFTLLATLRRMR